MTCEANYTWCRWPPRTPGDADHLCPVHAHQLFKEWEEAKATVARIPRYEDGPPALALDIAYQRIGEGQVVEAGPIRPVVNGLFSSRKAAEAKGGE